MWAAAQGAKHDGASQRRRQRRLKNSTHTTPRGLKPRVASTQPVIRKERITEPILEHIAVAVPGPQRVARAFPQESIVVDAPMPEAVEKVDTVIDVPVPQVLEESGKSAVPQIQEQIVEVVKVILQERVLERNLEQIHTNTQRHTHTRTHTHWTRRTSSNVFTHPRRSLKRSLRRRYLELSWMVGTSRSVSWR